MGSLAVSISPAQGVEVMDGAQWTDVDLTYRRVFEGTPGEDLADLPSELDETVRVPLDGGLRATSTLLDVKPSSTLELRFLSPTGSVRLRKVAEVGDLTPLTIELSKDEVRQITAAPPQPPAPPTQILRRAYFVQMNGGTTAFGRSTLQVAPIRIANGGWSQLGLDVLFGSEQVATRAVQWGLSEWSPTQIAWRETQLSVDGKFATSFPEGAGDAWLWWLSGAQAAIGVVIDDLAVARVQPIGLALPPFTPVGSDGPTGRTPSPLDESEVARNPDVYTEDPGEFCKPFKNPERVLGERAFFVTLRVEQPLIGPEPSVHTKPIPTLSFDLAPSLDDSGNSMVNRVVDAVRSRLGTLVSSAPAVSFVREAIPKPYLEMLRRLERGRTTLNATHPVQWEGDISRYQASTIARGHIIEYRMRWRSNGYSLGTVAKTLTLAPRQTKRIQKVEWERTEATRRAETTRLSDRVSDGLSRERSYEDTVRANLSEWSRGRSSASTTSAAAGFGFALPGFIVGGGGVASSAQSESSQFGGRDTAAAEEQHLRDTIRRYGDSLRQLESVVVTEVTQSENVTGTTEVVRNQNYAHALTVIYYQILRHLKIETAVAGVRECLFVPFAITPFTIARAYRWRELIRLGLKDQAQGVALKYLKDVLNGFAGSEVPPGRRSDQPIRYVFGSLFMKLAIERPSDKDDGSFDVDAWSVLRAFLGAPALSIFTRLKARAEAERDAFFQREHAPTIAATWVDTLELWAGSTKLDVDFTLATTYAFNGTVRVDFTAPVGQAISRETLASLRVVASKDLTPGSIAQLLNLSFTYETDGFERTVKVAQGAHDLVTVETGVHDAGATVFAPPDAWERRNIRQEMTTAVRGLVEHLNENVEHYHKVIWWNMDRDRLFMLIDGFYVPGTNGVSVGSVVERDPIAIMGNSLVFRVAAGAFLGLGSIKTPAQLLNHYVSGQAPSSPMLVSLPTDGLYAQTVMDECSALEEHFGSTDWALSQPDPELGTIAPELMMSRRAEPLPTTPTPFPQTIINLQNAPDAPAPQGFAAALAAVQNAGAFRDMAGLAGTQANAAAGLQAAAALASGFGAQAAALKMAEIAKEAQAAQTADQKLATVQRAVDKQLVDNAGAQQHASKILEELHSGAASLPHQDPALSESVRRAMGTPGSTIEATTADGQLKVSLAAAQLPGSKPITVCGFFANGGMVTETAARQAIVRHSRAQLSNWRTNAALLLETNAAQFGFLARHWLARRPDIPPTVLTPAQQLATGGMNFGALAQGAGAGAAAVNAARIAARNALLAGAPAAAGNLDATVDEALRFARLSRLDQRGGAWSAVFVTDCVRSATIELGLEHDTGGGNHVGNEALLRPAQGHAAYVMEAHRRATANPPEFGYHAFRVDARKPQVGDIIIMDRRHGDGMGDPPEEGEEVIGVDDVRTFDEIPTFDGPPLHGDVIVEVLEDRVETVGGNLGASARRRHFPLTDAGFLVVDATRDFVTERNDLTMPALPGPHGGATLTGSSTIRIFTLLSLVHECFTIPGIPGLTTGDHTLLA